MSTSLDDATREQQAGPATTAPLAVTDAAAQRIAAIVDAEGDPAARLRVSVSGGGCSGFQYHFDLDTAREEGDVLIRHGAAEVVIDDMSLAYLAGSTLDYVEDLTGSYFRLDNPNASSSCGCGTSFSI